ncbi:MULTISPECIES: sulfur carrier protein ThiS [Galbibacter]|uniref:Sulfur carrier protein ThiS n=1 Tax=Galbibacter pacificus TaxID=2996052 RepID=A0ABT6FS57_9FLAO|nr:sulfur carrier protein ThiS [Galbibacter pacificus]MDG3582778.1 sulfur carrier protein ThiS [Galbibacter pacificus]MDG3586103.1 sulfur carrier protein ThiS [Galbibacter pacificus]
MITVNVNSTKHTFSQGINTQELLEQLQVSPNGIAVAINNQVVPKAKWQETITNNANILIIKATQGG